MRRQLHATLFLTALCLGPSAGAGVIAFSTDFESGTPGNIGGAGHLRQISPGQHILQNDSPGRPAAATLLTLDNLAPHSDITLSFTFWAIDSWDGITNTCCGTDYFVIRLNGAQVYTSAFRNWGLGTAAKENEQSPYGFASLVFGNGTDILSTPGSLSWVDSIWTITLTIPHTEPSARFAFFATGTGWDGRTDESFGLDNILVQITPMEIPEPTSLMLTALGVMTALALPRRLGSGDRCHK